MADFELAVTVVLEHEGRAYADPRGGLTDYGISLAFLKLLPDEDGDGFSDGDLNRDGIVCPEDIRALSLTRAIEIYRTCFWDKYRYGELRHQEVATKVFDLCVNMGPGQAHRVVQRALATLSPGIVVDGILGPKSRGALNSLPPAHLLTEIRHQAARFYRSLDDSLHLKGWLNRAYA